MLVEKWDILNVPSDTRNPPPKRLFSTYAETELFPTSSGSLVPESTNASLLSPAKRLKIDKEFNTKKTNERSKAGAAISPVKMIGATGGVKNCSTHDQKSLNDVMVITLLNGARFYIKSIKSAEQELKEIVGSSMHRNIFQILLKEKIAGKSHVVFLNDRMFLASEEVVNLNVLQLAYPSYCPQEDRYKAWQAFPENFKTNLLTVFLTSTFVLGNADPNYNNIYTIGRLEDGKCGILDFERCFTLVLPMDAKRYELMFSAMLNVYLKVDLSVPENSELVKNVVGTILEHQDAIKDLLPGVFRVADWVCPEFHEQTFSDFSLNLQQCIARIHGIQCDLYNVKKKSVANKCNLKLEWMSYLDNALASLNRLHTNWQVYSVSAISEYVDQEVKIEMQALELLKTAGKSIGFSDDGLQKTQIRCEYLNNSEEYSDVVDNSVQTTQVYHESESGTGPGR